VVSASTPPSPGDLRLYTSSVYMACLPGGWVADRLLGARRAVLYGGILIAAGHFSMALQALPAFYFGLTLIVVGTGLLKGNVAVIVGQLYTRDDHRRDAGFSIFYMGINLGAFIAPLICGYLGQRVGWHFGFGAAGVGMTLGIVQYMLGSRSLGDAGVQPAQTLDPAAKRWASAVALSAVLVGAGMFAGVIPITATQIADAAGILLIGGAIAFFAWLFLSSGWTPAERHRLYAIAILFLACLPVLVAVRAGRLDAQPVRGSGDTDRDLRLDVSEQLLSVAAAAVHHHLRAGVRVVLDAARQQRTVEPDQVRVRAGVRGYRVRAARPGRDVRRHRPQDQPDVAGRDLSAAHVGRARTQPRSA
jgi:hypothetical protein